MRSAKRKLLDRALQGLDLPACKFKFWDGEELSLGPENGSEFTIYFRDRKALASLFPNLVLGFADGYADGRIDIEGDFLRCLSLGYESRSASRRLSWLQRLQIMAHRWDHRNTRPGSRRNVCSHYDLGNDFYQRWLDDNMLYTCAYYPTPEATLEAAQISKMDLVCRKLRLQPGESVVEAGCGWGGFAIFAAKHYGVSVKAFNLSREQIAYAREWVKRECVSSRVEFIHDDYRNMSGGFDVFASIGMLEHVGKDHYFEFGRVMDRCLRPGGRGLLHFIGRTEPAPLNPWISRNIFPGGHPPSLSEISPVFERHGFYIKDLENLRLHYARTLQHWLERFENHAAEIGRQRGDRFVRAWRLYLAGSMLSFLYGYLVLYQVLFSKGLDPGEPMTRRFIYENV